MDSLILSSSLVTSFDKSMTLAFDSFIRPRAMELLPLYLKIMSSSGEVKDIFAISRNFMIPLFCTFRIILPNSYGVDKEPSRVTIKLLLFVLIVPVG